MSFGTEFNRGLRAYGEAHRVIFRHGLTKYLWIPGLVTIAYSIVFFVLAAYWAGNISDEADSYPGWLSWLGDATHWFVRVVYWSLAVLVFWASLKYVLQVLLAPVLSNLSVAVERKLWGREPDPFTLKEYLQDMGRSLLLSIRNSILEIVLCIFIGFIPVIGQVGGIIVSGYFYGFGYMDYVLERKKYNIPQAVTFVRAHKGLAVGVGVVAALLMLVPVIGWLITPTYATVAATLETLRILHPEDAGRVDVFVKTSDQ